MLVSLKAFWVPKLIPAEGSCQNDSFSQTIKNKFWKLNKKLMLLGFFAYYLTLKVNYKIKKVQNL